MKVIAYMRVSSETQLKDGYGLADQERLIRKWCREHGHRLVAIYRDEAKSGSLPATERPGLLDAIGAIENGSAEGIILRDLDRIARTLTTQEVILAEIWKNGGHVFVTATANEIPKDDPDDPYRTAMRQMMGVFAQLERAMAVKRMRDGRKTKAANGGYAGYGSPAFGQRTDGKELVADATEQAAIAHIGELHGAGKSLREIITVLEAEGIQPKRGDRWYPATVSRVIGRLTSGEN